MKKVLLFAVSVLVFFVAKAQEINDFTFVYGTTTYNTIVGNGGIFLFGEDDWDAQLDLTGQFSFLYNGNEYSQFTISKNGAISLGFGTVSMLNEYLADPEQEAPRIAPLWDWQQFSNENAGAYYKLDGSQLIIEWDGTVSTNGTSSDNGLHYQLILDNSDGSITFVYGDLSDAQNYDMTASIGINDYQNNTGYFWSVTPSTPPTASNTTGDVDISGSEIASIPEGTFYKFIPNLPDHDLTIDYISPQFSEPQSTITPYVLVLNKGSQTENSYTVRLMNNYGYDQTVNANQEVASQQKAKILFPEWTTPAEQGYNVIWTAIVTVAGDTITNNDTLVDTVLVSDFYEAYAFSNGKIYKYIFPQDTMQELIAETDKYFLSATFDLYGNLYLVYDDLNNGSFNLASFDTATNQLHEIGALFTDDDNYSFHGLTYNPINNKFYAAVRKETATDKSIRFYEVNVNNANAEQLSIDPNTDGKVALLMQCDLNGNFYLITQNNGTHIPVLYKVDVYNGDLQEIGSFGTEFSPYYFLSDLSVLPNGELVYHNYGNFSTKGGFYKIDTTTATETYWGGFDLLPFVMAIPYPTYHLEFVVKDVDNQPLENVKILVSDQEALTNSDGVATFELIQGEYQFITETNCYADTNGIININSDTTINLILDKDAKNVTFNTVANNEPVDNVSIIIYENNSAIDTLTTQNGTASTALFCGEYSYEATANGFETATGNIEISSDTTFTINLTPTLVGKRQISVYPNPAKDFLILNLKSKSDIALTTANGKQVLTKSGVSGKQLLDVSSLPAGVYILKIKTSEETVSTVIIKE